ncbi:MAG: hypothetical protein GF421_03725 [Candidatus Aminicenantes bacterium]|nr:hypothetical protein [Candidatus Aminicenantes bacterium]
MMRISPYLDKDCIKIPLENEKKHHIIQELLDLITEKYDEVDQEITLQSLLEREKIETTGIGENVAIPHARIKKIQKVYFAFGIAQKGVEFDSLDQRPVRLVFLILCPEKKVNTQIGLLARLSRFVHDKRLRKKLLKCQNSQDVIRVFTKYEDKHFS